MSDRSNIRSAAGAAVGRPQHRIRSSAVSRSQQKLTALQQALVQAKAQLRKSSIREQSIRECVVGRAVLALIEQGVLTSDTIALVRAEVHSMLTPGRAPAFVDTLFELPA